MVQPAISGVSLPLTQVPEEASSPKAIQASASMDVASDETLSAKKKKKASKKKGKSEPTASTPKTKKAKQ